MMWHHTIFCFKKYFFVRFAFSFANYNEEGAEIPEIHHHLIIFLWFLLN